MSVQEDIQRAIEELEQIIASRAPTAPPRLILELEKAKRALIDFGSTYDARLAEKSTLRPRSGAA
jgi:hypothetical protein